MGSITKGEFSIGFLKTINFLDPLQLNQICLFFPQEINHHDIMNETKEKLLKLSEMLQAAQRPLA